MKLTPTFSFLDLKASTVANPIPNPLEDMMSFQVPKKNADATNGGVSLSVQSTHRIADKHIGMPLSTFMHFL